MPMSAPGAPTSMPATRPSLSNRGRHPPPSELTVTRSAGRPAVPVALQRILGGPGILPVFHGECGDVDGRSALGQLHRLGEERLPAVDVRRVEDPRRQFARVERLAHQLEAAGAVAHVQVHDAGLAAHQPAHVRLRGEPQQVVQRGLARAMVADRHLADPDDLVDERDVAADRAAQRRRRQVIAAGVAPGGEPELPESARRPSPARRWCAPRRRCPAPRSPW